MRTVIYGDNVVLQIGAKFGQDIPRGEAICMAERIIGWGEGMILGSGGHISHPVRSIDLVNASLVHTGWVQTELCCGGRAVSGLGHSDFLARSLRGDRTGPQNRGVITLGFDTCR